MLVLESYNSRDEQIRFIIDKDHVILALLNRARSLRNLMSFTPIKE
jgi:hypothetical protein